MGVFMVPMVPIGNYITIKLSRPVSEALSSGIMMILALLSSTIMIYIISSSLSNTREQRDQDMNKVYQFIIANLVILTFAFASTFFIQLRSTKEERQALWLKNIISPEAHSTHSKTLEMRH